VHSIYSTIKADQIFYVTGTHFVAVYYVLKNEDGSTERSCQCTKDVIEFCLFIDLPTPGK